MDLGRKNKEKGFVPDMNILARLAATEGLGIRETDFTAIL